MGCGVVAGYGHIPAILEADGLELVDPFESNLLEMQKRYHIPHAFTQLEDFFASGIEAVTITSPAPCHKANILDCAKRHLPVLCEKPLSMNGEESQEMIAAMKAAGLPLHVGFCYRFSPSALKIRELVRSGAIGEVKSTRLIYNWSLAGKYVTDAEGNQVLQQRREGRMAEGGPMVDCGTHQIDLALFWLDSPIVRFTGHGAWVDEYEAPDHMWVHMDHANGAHTVVEISYSYAHTSANRCSEFVYELIGTKGFIQYDRERQTLFMENETGHHDFAFHHEKDFKGMYQEWSHALHTGHSEMLTTAEQGMLVADIARQATDEAIRNRLQTA